MTGVSSCSVYRTRERTAVCSYYKRSIVTSPTPETGLARSQTETSHKTTRSQVYGNESACITAWQRMYKNILCIVYLNKQQNEVIEGFGKRLLGAWQPSIASYTIPQS